MMMMMRAHEFAVREIVPDIMLILKEMRKDEVPLYMIRYQQLCLWALRRLIYHPEYVKRVQVLGPIARFTGEFPGWEDNYRKFVLIHESQGRA